MKIRFLTTSIALLAVASLVHAQAPSSTDVADQGSVDDSTIIYDSESFVYSDDFATEDAEATWWGAMYRPGRVSVEAELMYWFLQGQELSPLITTSVPGTPRNQAGVLGLPTTSTLVGESRDNEETVGGRISLMYWLDEFHGEAVEVRFMAFEEFNTIFKSASTGDPIFARPFNNTQTGLPDSQLIAYPGVATGAMQVNSRQQFMDIEINFRQMLSEGPNNRVELMLGLYYIQFDDYLEIRDTLTSIDPSNAPLLGTFMEGQERFETENYMFGGQIGLETELRHGIAFLRLSGRFGIGPNVEVLRVKGITAFTVPGIPRSATPTGLLVDGSNFGDYTSQLDFGFVTEVGVKLGLDLTRHVTVTAGYSFLYLLPVVHPADVISVPTVDPNLLGPTVIDSDRAEAEEFGNSEAWLQGFNAGAEIRF